MNFNKFQERQFLKFYSAVIDQLFLYKDIIWMISYTIIGPR